MASAVVADTRSSEEKEFEQRMMKILNDGVIALGISIGSASGLFETMAEFNGPRSSSEIADAAGLKERYVREWLGAMVTSDIVEVDPKKHTYFLPPYRAKSLSRNRGNGCVATVSDGVPLLAGVFQDILNCMKKDGPAGE
ncbi:S-adenosylmethionine-dependent methyltransferase Rv2258c-like [Saccoglossus kowalevskii]